MVRYSGWVGKTFKSRHYEFMVGNKIGAGGNGCVFKVHRIRRDGIEQCDKYAIKILHKDCNHTRYERFKKEIKNVADINRQNPSIKIIKIFDYDTITKNKSWYLMLEGQSFFEYCKQISFTEKIKYMLELANIMCDLHDLGYQHRDIKIDNLLILNKILYLADFGLIFKTNDLRVTHIKERLGPYSWGPPELEDNSLSITDFKPSDVYLFAKTVWICFKEKPYGFRGVYERTSQFYLDSASFHVFTLEPIHEMLEKATKNEREKRINIQECRNLLQKQLKIAIDKKPDKDAYINKDKESTLEILKDDKEDSRVYRDINVILKIVKEKILSSTIYVTEGDKSINIDGVKIYNDEGMIILADSKQNNDYLCCPDCVIIKNKELVELHTKNILDSHSYGEFTPYAEVINREWGGAGIHKRLLNKQMHLRFKTKT